MGLVSVSQALLRSVRVASGDPWGSETHGHHTAEADSTSQASGLGLAPPGTQQFLGVIWADVTTNKGERKQCLNHSQNLGLLFYKMGIPDFLLSFSDFFPSVACPPHPPHPTPGCPATWLHLDLPRRKHYLFLNLNRGPDCASFHTRAPSLWTCRFWEGVLLPGSTPPFIV